MKPALEFAQEALGCRLRDPAERYCGTHPSMYARRWPCPTSLRLAALIEARDREVRADECDDIAEALPRITEGESRVGTRIWPDCERDIYSLAIEEAQSAVSERAAAHVSGERTLIRVFTPWAEVPHA